MQYGTYLKVPYSFLAREAGVALLLVIFVILLASMLVIDLAYSTTLGSQISANLQRSAQAEYILKSAVNLARVLIKEDKTREDSERDLWGKFINGMPVPVELLGVSEKNVRIELEIRPEDSKMPIGALIQAGFPKPIKKWEDAFLTLFKDPYFDFDNDKEEDQTGIFPERHFNSTELLGILIDYMDSDKDSYDPGGIEGESGFPSGLFPDTPIKRVSELSGIPGFTPARVRKLMPFISAISSNNGSAISKVNINLAPSIILKSLSPNLDDKAVQAIIDFRKSEDGPFTEQNLKAKLDEIIGDQNISGNVWTMTTAQSRWFQVIAKIDYGTSLYFMRAYLLKGSAGELPEIQSVELF